MREKKYVVMIAPIPWKRAGLNGQRFFDGQQADKVMFGLHLRAQHKDEPLFADHPLEIDMIFYMAIPASVKARTKVIYHKSRPDCDNLVKFCLDGMKSVVIKDDAIISILHAKKIYDPNPRIEFTIKEL